MTESTVWHQEQKTSKDTEYYVLLRDGEKTISFILKHNIEKNEVIAEPYSPPDIDYTIHDGCDHENDDCVLEDPDSMESQEVYMADRFSITKQNLDLLEANLKDKSILERIQARKEKANDA